MYITIDKYIALYGVIEESAFNRFSFEACKYIDRATTGIDGVKKLKAYFPSNEDSSESVSRCAAEIVNVLLQINEAEKSASVGRGYVHTENGVHGKVVTSVAAGNESVSYSTANEATSYDAAVSDLSARDVLVSKIIRKYLSGETDANGVNLLYLGVYPRV